MSKLEHFDGNGMIETSLTEDHGIYAKDLTWPQHKEMLDKMGKADSLDGVLLEQCRAMVRDVNGDEFENLQTLDDLHRFGMHRIKSIVAACVEAIKVKI